MICYVIEKNINIEIVKYLKSRGDVILENLNDFIVCDVIIVSNVKKFKESLDIVDWGLQRGIEILCIKPKFGINSIICNVLISEGAKFV